MAEITQTTCCPPQQQTATSTSVTPVTTTTTPMEETTPAPTTTTDVTRSASKRGKLGRKLSRRLSLVTKVPNMIGVKLKSEFGSRDSVRTRAHSSRHLEITVIAPDKSQRILGTESPETVTELVSLLVAEYSVQVPRLTLAGSHAEVDPNADVSLLEGDILIVEEGLRTHDPRAETDSRYRLTEDFCMDEAEYVVALRSAGELYGAPLRRMDCLQPVDHQILFDALGDLAAVCSQLMDEVKDVLATWDPNKSSVGHLFSKQVWSQYEEYQDMYRRARQLLREKSSGDDDFVELCKLRRGAAKHTLQSLLDLPVQRLAQYEHYFQSLLNETNADHADHEDINRAKAKAKQAVKRGQEESDLERIQDLFPNDCLRLYDKDVLTMKMKGLIRKRSSTAARLQRALSAKSLRPESPPPPRASPGTTDKRVFLMEAPVQFTTGVQSQERHLFLFNDLLLIAKARSGGNFKLKDKVRVSELWLTRCSLDDVTELNKSADTSFVIGWPTTNVVATFTTQAARDLWWNKLNEVLATEREKEPCSTNIQVVYFDLNTSIEYCKTFSVGPEETARDCIKLALEHLEMRGLDPAHFQLWAKTAREEAPYPLIGHERPFAIKLSCLREGLSSEEGFDLDHCNNVHDPLARCHFILRSTCKPPDSETKKSGKKSSGRMRIGQVFRRSLSKDSSGCLFGLPLAKICEGDNLPRPVMAMLQQVFAKGPFTQGIFRKSANARLVRELRDKLDNGEEVTWEHVPVLVTAALLKDFLRSLPDPLLTSNLYPQWKSALDTPNTHHKLLRLKGVLQQLPKPNHMLLSHFLCVLHHISRRSSQNLMSAANLGVCVGPSLLWSDVGVVGEELRAIPSLVECLITHCQVLCGTHVPHLLGDPRDSGTEESDSLRRDDSSIDSLECSPPPRKDKMSLSRDSGLTMSDSQLYTPDEEESGSTSSSGYDPAFDPHTKVTPSLSVPGEYVRVYGGWEERLNPNFQRQAWFRQRSRRLSSVTPNNKSIEEAVRRSASEESLLDTQPPPTPPRRAKPEVIVPDVPKTIPEVVHTPRKSSEPLKQSDMNGKCSEIIVNQDCVENFKTELTIKPAIRDITTSVNFPDDKFGRHPPLRKVTAVHCEVVSDQSSRTQYKENNQSAVYGVNGVKKLSLSSAELSYNSSKSLEQSFVSVRSGDVSYSPQRIQESYSSIRSEQSFSRSLDQSFSSSPRVNESYNNQSPRLNQSSRSNQSPRSNDSPRQNRVVSEQNYGSPKLTDKTVLGFGAGDYYYAVREDIDEVRGSECEDSSTLSDDDCTPHVSRSNSRGNEVTTKLRHLPPVHVDTCFVRGRLKRKEERAAHRSRSLPPPPPYRPPPPANTQNRRAPITSYYLGDCSQSQRYVVTRTFMDEESYV